MNWRVVTSRYRSLRRHRVGRRRTGRRNRGMVWFQFATSFWIHLQCSQNVFSRFGDQRPTSNPRSSFALNFQAQGPAICFRLPGCTRATSVLLETVIIDNVSLKLAARFQPTPCPIKYLAPLSSPSPPSPSSSQAPSPPSYPQPSPSPLPSQSCPQSRPTHFHPLFLPLPPLLHP